MDDPQTRPAVETLLAFFRERYALGLEALRYIRSVDREEGVDAEEWHEVMASQRAGLEAIFVRYCTAGLAAKRLKDSGFAVQDPPKYDPDHETVASVSLSGGSVFIETVEDVEADWRYRYELIQVDDRYLIKDNKRFRLGPDGEWKPHIL